MGKGCIEKYNDATAPGKFKIVILSVWLKLLWQ